MSLRGTINNAVDTAFRAVGDIGETVTLRTSNSTEYDFTTGKTTSNVTETSVTAIVLYVDQDLTAEVVLSPRKEVLVKETDLPDPKVYDIVIINNQEHSIISYKVEPGLVTLIVTEA
jgi:hypothetical protein